MDSGGEQHFHRAGGSNAQLDRILPRRGCNRPRGLYLAQQLLRRRGISRGNPRSVPFVRAQSGWLRGFDHPKRFHSGPMSELERRAGHIRNAHGDRDAVWQNVCVCGSGLIFNRARRAAFESQAFVEYWCFVRFPCGKWSAMLIYEGSMVQYLLCSTPEMRCLTFTNDIHILSPVTAWRERGIPFYKHKKDSSVLDYIASHASVAPANDFHLETCIL